MIRQRRKIESVKEDSVTIIIIINLNKRDGVIFTKIPLNAFCCILKKFIINNIRLEYLGELVA